MDTDCSEALPFEDRADAGVALGRRLLGIRWPAPAIVLGIPRGGVAVAREVARILRQPLDALVVRKVRHPSNPELAIGAVAAGGILVRNPGFERSISREQFDALAAAQRVEVEQLEIRLRPGRGPLSLEGRTALLVDDGIATGATMRSALRAARALGAVHVVAAVPVGAREAVEELRKSADQVICLYSPEPFQSIGLNYANFAQVRDADARIALDDVTVAAATPRWETSPPTR